MSELARRLIQENIAQYQRGEDATYLDLGKCGLTYLPPELEECVWVETLILSNLWNEYDFEKKKWEQKESQNTGAPNQISSIKGVESLNALKMLIAAKHWSEEGANWELHNLSSLSKLTTLQGLNCYKTKVSDLHPLAGLTALRELYCSMTQISDLSPIVALSSLQKLNFSFTQVNDLSPLTRLTALQELDCSKTEASDLSPLADLTSIQELYCDNTKISDLSPLAALNSLQKLNFSHTQVNDLSPLVALNSLQELDCSSTKVSDLSPLAGLTALQKLDCGRTKIGDLRPVGKLSSLQELHCSSTEVSDLSPLAGLTALQKLDCGRTKIGDLRPVGELSSLQELHCSSTKVSDLSPLAGLTALQKLDCGRTKIGDLRPVGELSSLQELHCSSTKVSDLSPLVKLTALQALNCTLTQISDLHPLAGLTALRWFDCSGTYVSDLRPLAGLIALRLLNCSETYVSNLHPLAGLTILERLDCYNTRVSDLRPLAKLTALQELYCFETRIKDLAPLLHLIKEEKISVRWHDFKDHLRKISFNWQDRRAILVKDCPLTNPPREIVEQGNEAILNYFAERERTGTEKSLEAKVVLIGEGQAGKTSLLTRLLRPGKPLPNKEDRTKGLDIEIEKYRYPLASGEEMRLNVFDFAGQDHYKPLHRFFYSKNTLYVLVSKNGDAAVNDFDYWLDTAQLFGQNSPVLLVHNLFGDVRSNFNRQKYARFDDTIKECLDVNLANFTDRRWEEVQSRIEYFASRLPHVHEEIPKSWANVRRALLARREEQVMDVEDYFALCALPENGGMNEARALRCSAYLHDIGILLHYQDDADLREYVIIKNEWATEAAYRVIDDPEIAERNGHFYRQTDLSRIWHQREYRKMRPQLLQFMRRFRLCYPLKTAGEFIAPQLLPSSPPAGYLWAEAQDLVMYIEYDFMPPGLMAQLIVECHLLIAEDRQLVWRDGAVLELTGGEARAEILLQKRSGKQTIGIRAQGRKARDLMTVVDAKLEELHRTFGSGLRVEKKIPCVCPQCKVGPKRWFFNLSELEKRLQAGRRSKECEISYDSVSIDALLGNVFSNEIRKRDGRPVPRAFFSYSKADKAYLDEFKKHLVTCQRAGEIEAWDDSRIRPGEEWDAAIKSELARADLIFLLVSVDFLNTDYIWETEIQEAMRRHEAGEATVIPIKIRDCEWSHTPFGKLQGLPRKDSLIGPKPVNDTAWKEVVEEVREVLARRLA